MVSKKKYNFFSKSSDYPHNHLAENRELLRRARARPPPHCRSPAGSPDTSRLRVGSVTGKAIPAYIDKNYAGIFIVWDRLFGTFELENEAVVYGILKPIRTWNPVVANVARSKAEAKTQAKTGKAVVSTEEEEAQAAQAQAETAETEGEAKPKTKKKAKPTEIGEEEAKVVEEAADEAAAEQAEEIFEEGAAPQPEPEDAAADKAADDAGDKTK